MNLSNYQSFNPEKNPLVFLFSLGEFGLSVMKEIAELQFTFVSSQMESVYEQFNILSNVNSYDYFLSAYPSYDTWNADVLRTPANINPTTGEKPVVQADKRIKVVTATKSRSTTRRKTRKKKT